MLLITTLILCALGFYDYNSSKQRLDLQLEYETGLLINRLQLNLPPAMWNIDDDYIVSVLGSEAKAKFIRGIYIQDEKGRFLQGIERQGDKITSIERIPPAGASGYITSKLTYIEHDSGDEYGVGNAILDITDEENIALLEAEIKSQAIQVAALNIVLLILFSVVINRMTKPLAKLKDLASSIALGDYNLEIDIKRNDEIGELSESFTTMKEGIKKKVQDLRDLNQISEELAVCSVQTVALEKTLHALSVHSNVQFGSVYLYNNEDSLELKCFYPPKVIDRDVKPRKFENGEGIVGQASAKREIIHIPNTLEDNRFINDVLVDSQESAHAEITRVEGINDDDSKKGKAIICIPLVDNNISLGVLNLSGKVGEVQFVETDYEYAETISRQLVTTIKNIRMREVIEEQNRNLEAKVEERTTELRQKNHDIANMMQNMHQGLFTITLGGMIHQEYAAYLEEIFETKRIAERNFADLLFGHSLAGPDQVDQNITAVDAIVGEEEMMYDFNSHCLMKEMIICLNDNHEKILELDWDPIISESGLVDKLMVTVRDVTALKALEAEAEEQKLELEIIGEVLAVDAGKFNDFINTSHEFLAECLSVIERTSEKDADAIARLFRSMHTVKGNARTYGLKHITNIVHEVESTYDDLRKNDESTWDAKKLLKELDGAEKIIIKYANVFRDKLGRDKEVSNAISLDPERVSSWLSRINNITSVDLDDSVKDMVSEAYSMLISMNAKPIDEVIADVISSANSLADQLGKVPPNIQINNAGLLIDSGAYNIINNIFMHVFRNAIDHGIEGIEERKQKGKPEQGLIKLEVSLPTKGGANIAVQDDGRGLAINRIYKMAVAKGIFDANEPMPPASEIANLVFGSGFSTAEAVTDVSGRGVGMDAVRGFLEKEGGSIEIILDEQTKKSEFHAFTTNIYLPEKLYKISVDFAKAS